MCQPKDKGSLGVINIKIQNQGCCSNTYINSITERMCLGCNSSGQRIMRIKYHTLARLGGEMCLNYLMTIEESLKWMLAMIILSFSGKTCGKMIYF